MLNDQTDLPTDSEQHNFSVLLVEDDEDVFNFVKRSLQLTTSAFPAFVDHARNLDEAIQKLQQVDYHLLLVESEVGKKSGLNLLEQIRSLGVSVPFVLMTSVKDENLVREATKRGVADLIVKSESHFQELSEKLKKSYLEFKSKNQEKPSGKMFFNSAMAAANEVTDQKNVKDELTGLYNHSYLHARIVNEFSRATRHRYPISCLLIDIDNFRDINEKYGYPAGEEILKECAGLIFDNSRLSDFVARYGGEEFAVLLPHINYEGAREMAGRLRRLFAEHVFLEKDQPIRLTISIGLSSFPEDTIEQRGELISFANQALLRSKAVGRNCVTLYQDIVPLMEEGFPVIRISEEKVVEFQHKMGEISNSARRGYVEASKALITALEAKDSFTAGHSARIGKYSLEVAQIMGMSTDDCEMVQHAGMLHDIGKICIPDEILLKPSRLTLMEYESMKQHPYFGYKILKPIKFLQQEALFVLHHHEWFNGEGYPCRLKGSEIPLGARIIAVTDTYDTIRSAGGRYKKTDPVEATVNELVVCSGTQFDPEVVKAFIEVLKQRGELSKEYNSERLEQIIIDFPRK